MKMKKRFTMENVLEGIAGAFLLYASLTSLISWFGSLPEWLPNLGGLIIPFIGCIILIVYKITQKALEIPALIFMILMLSNWIIPHILGELPRWFWWIGVIGGLIISIILLLEALDVIPVEEKAEYRWE